MYSAVQYVVDKTNISLWPVKDSKNIKIEGIQLKIKMFLDAFG